MQLYFSHETIRESQKELVDEIISCLENKKNLIAHAPTGIGKCVSGDTLILTNEGLNKIKDLYLKQVKLNSLNKILKIKVKNGIIINKKKSKLFKITTKIGREIKVTKDHKFLVIGNGVLEWKKLEFLKKGDYIACPRKLNLIKGKMEIKIKNLENLPEGIKKGITFDIKRGIGNIIRDHIKKKVETIRGISRKTGISREYIKSLLKNKTIGYYKYKKISNIIPINENNIINKISTKSRQSEIEIEFSKDFAYFTGLMIGDGHIPNDGRYDLEISNIDKEILDFYKEFFKKRNRKIYKKSGDKCDYITSYKAMAYFLIILGINAGNKSGKVKIHNIFFKNKELLREVLRGIYDTDGSVYDTFVELVTKSKNIKECVLHALLCFGIIPIIKKKYVKGKKYYRIYTCDVINNKKFYENIGFRLSRKQLLLKKIIDKKSNPNIDIIPDISEIIKRLGKKIKVPYDRKSNEYRKYESYIYNLRRPSKNGLKSTLRYLKKFDKNKIIKNDFLKNLAGSDIFWDKIKEIRYSGKDIVYDATIPETENFIGNGIILHNTSAAISPTLSFALNSKKTVIFITPKHTQHKIAIETLKQIKEKHNLNFIVVDLVGKKHMCAQPGVSEMHQNEFSDYCKHMVENKMCDYYNNLKDNHKLSLQTELTIKELSNSILHIEELKDISSKAKLCPFEVAMLLSEKAKVIIADYHHLLNVSIRETILKKINKDISDLIIIFDEAHNIPSKCRDLLSVQLSIPLVEFAAKEAASMKYNEISEDIMVIKEILEKLSRTKTTLQDKEALIKKEEFMKELTTRFNYDEFLNNLLFIAEETAEIKKRSACKAIASFLINWQGPDQAFARILSKGFSNKGKPVITLSYQCLDPSLIIKPLVENSYSSIFMSGTLNPVDMYKDLFNIETKTIELKNPFPKKNKLSIVIPDTTTKFTARSDEMFERIAKYCADICNIIPGNIIIFFPSYDIRDKINNYFIKICDKTILIDSPELNKEEKIELIEKLKQYKTYGAVLLSAASGSLGEGLDFPDNILKSVIVVGIPLDRPNLETKELINYYDIKFKKGWDYGYIMPALIRSLQNAGRCIRSERDKGVIIYLDQRYIWENYFKCFPKDLFLKITKEPIPKIKEFFEI